MSLGERISRLHDRTLCGLLAAEITLWSDEHRNLHAADCSAAAATPHPITWGALPTLTIGGRYKPCGCVNDSFTAPGGSGALRAAESLTAAINVLDDDTADDGDGPSPANITNAAICAWDAYIYADGQNGAELRVEALSVLAWARKLNGNPPAAGPGYIAGTVGSWTHAYGRAAVSSSYLAAFDDRAFIAVSTLTPGLGALLDQLYLPDCRLVEDLGALDDVIAETTLRLWDPDNVGALRNFGDAYDAAVALHR